MAQTVPYLRAATPPSGVTYKCDSADADDVHIVAKFQTRTNMTYMLECDVLVAQYSDTVHTPSAVNAYRIIGGFKNIAGTVTQAGSTVVVTGTNIEDDAGWSCTYAISGTEIRVQLTLDASHTSSAPVEVRTHLRSFVELGALAPHRFGSADNDPA